MCELEEAPPHVLKERAKALIRNFQWKEAHKILLQIKMIYPNNDKLLCKIGDVHKELNNIDAAKYYYLESLRINSQNSTIYNKLGLLYHNELHNLCEAETCYLRAINIASSINEINFAYFLLGKLYIEQKKNDEAINSFKKCLQIDPNKAAVHYHYGILLLSMKDEKMAYDHFKRAKRIKPNIANYYFEHAKISAKLGYFIKANKSFIKALELSNSSEPKYMYQYAMYFKKYKKNHQLALFYINLALKINPNDINYKYQYLDIRQEKQFKVENNLCIFRIKENKYDCNRYNLFSLKSIIFQKCELLIYGYLSHYNLNIKSSLIIPSEIQYICYQYFIGNYVSKINCNIIKSDKLYFNEFGKTEIIDMIFNVLCPGNDETKIIFTMTKLLDLMDYGIKYKKFLFSINYLSILLSITEITRIYYPLSLIDDNEIYLDKIVIIPTQFASTTKISISKLIILFLTKCFNENNIFYQRYKELIHNDLIKKEQIMCHIINNSMSLEMIRKYTMPLLFDNDDDDNINIGISTINKLIQIMQRQNKYNKKSLISLNWLKLEMECINKNDLNEEIKTRLHHIVRVCWIRFIHINNKCIKCNSMRSIYYDIFKLFVKYDIDLKLPEFQWEAFYFLISSILINDSNFNAILLDYCLKKIQIDDEEKENWKFCVQLLMIDRHLLQIPMRIIYTPFADDDNL